MVAIRTANAKMEPSDHGKDDDVASRQCFPQVIGMLVREWMLISNSSAQFHIEHGLRNHTA